MNEVLNLPCRYKVFQRPGLLYYTFTTDNNVEYAVTFDDDSTLFDDTSVEGLVTNIYSLTIEKVTLGVFPVDSEVQNTVTAIIERFFQNPSNVLTYYCDPSDKRELKRKNHFDRWFNSYSHKHNYNKLDQSINAGAGTIHTSLIFNSYNEQSAHIIAGELELNHLYKNKP